MISKKLIGQLYQQERLWDLYTRKEEYSSPFYDQYGRFPHYLSNQRNIFEPEVSQFFHQNGLVIEYPDNKKFAVCLTHDIDVIYPSYLQLIRDAAHAWKNHRFSDLMNIPLSRGMKSKNPYWNFEKILQVEESYGAKSSFFILTLDKGERDYNFPIEDLHYEIGTIIDRGSEIGLHGGHTAYLNAGEITTKKKMLEKVSGRQVIGYRNHFLKLKVPETWRILKEVGFEYDTTFGYADCAGFRNGTCHPFKPFDLRTNNEIDIWEIPLAIMDCTLFEYMNLDPEQAWALCRRLIDSVEEVNGVLGILWHNTHMDGDYFKIYQKILSYCSEKDGWMTSGEEIIRHYQSSV